MTLRVLCAEPQNYSTRALEILGGWVNLDADDLPQETFAIRARDYDALMVRLQRRVTRDILAHAPRVKAILSPTTGLDHIDLQAAKTQGVSVFSLCGEIDFLRNVHASAEHTFTLMLTLMRNIPMAFEAVKSNRWEQTPFRGHEVHGKILGIVGYGRIGTKLASYAQAFGMRVQAYDPYVEHFSVNVEPVLSLDRLLETSEILSINVALNSETERMIGARELGILPPSAFLINTARGAIIDEAALITNLENHHLAGAAVDVVRDEHLIVEHGHPLIEYARTHTNLIITPHIGGATWEAIEKTDLFVIDKFKKWVNDSYKS